MHHIYHFPRLLETRKHRFLFRFLMIVLDEVTHDLRRVGEDVGIEILAFGELPHCRFINQEHAIEYAMLAHEVLGRRGLHFPVFCCLSALLRDGRGHEPADRDCRTEDLEESAARRIDLFDHVSLPTPKLCCAMQKAPIPGQASQTGSFLRVRGPTTPSPASGSLCNLPQQNAIVHADPWSSRECWLKQLPESAPQDRRADR